MNYKIIFLFMLIGLSLISTTLAASPDRKFDEENKTLMIKDTIKNNDLLKIEQVSSKPDLVRMEEEFKITSYEDYTFKNTDDFKIRWQKYKGKNDILKANWEILETEEYDVTLPDFQLIEKSQEIPNILSYTNVTDVYDLNPWMLDWGVHSKEEWEIITSEGKGTVGFDRHVITSTNPLNITFFWYEHEIIGSHNVTRNRDNWKQFSPDGKKIKKDESITVKLTFSKKAETGNHSIKTIPMFAKVEAPQMTWWNASWGHRIDNPIPNGVRPYQLSLTLSNAIGSNDATHVFFNGHSKSDFSDVRFTLDNTTPLSYWIEEGTGKVWVNVTANGIVNLYYGNPSATDSSNGKKTFEFFDDFEPESWKKLQKLPKPHSDQAGAVLGGKIYTIGGYDTSYTVPTGLVWAYDPVTNTYSQKKNLTFARWGEACAGYSGNIYCFGGEPNHKTEKYYPVNNTWITISEPPLPLQGQGLTAVVGGSYIYLFRAGNLYKYNPINNVYTLLNNAPPHNIQNWPSMAFYNNEIYILGGNYADNGINFVQIYNLANNVWRNGAPMPIGLYGTLRENPIINNKIYILQGQGIWNNFDFYSRYWVYNIVTNSWDWGELGYWDADGVSGGVIGNKVYTFGGRRGHGTNDRGTTFAGVLDTSKNIQAKWIDVKMGAWREDYSYLTNGMGQRYPTVQIRTAERVVKTNSKVISRMKYSSGSSGYGGLIIQSNDGVYGSNNNGYLDPFISITANRDELRKQTGSSSTLLGTRSLASPDVWHTYVSYYDTSSIKSTRDGANNIVVSDGTYRGGYIQVMKSIGFDLLIDYIAVARYVTNEPSWATWSQEPSDPTTGLVISNIAATSGKAYSKDTLAIGKLFYIDRTYKFTGVPPSYTGLNYIKTATDDRYRTESNFLQFDVNKDVTAYVAYDDRISPKPSWLTSFFTDTGDNLVRDDSSTFSIYARNYPAGHISLGGTSIPSGGAGGSYVVIVKPQGSPLPSTLTVSISESPDPVNSGGTSQVTVQVTSGGSNVAGANVGLSITGGSLSSSTGATDVNGKFTVTYTAPSVTTSTTHTISATASKTGFVSGSGSDLITVSPGLSGLAITNIVAASGKNYIIDTLAIGKLFYFDRTYTFTSIPSSYTGLKYIKTSTDDRYRTESNFLQFDVNKDVTVYVAYDDRISPKPSWLTSFFTDTGDNLVRDDSSTFSIYSRNYPAGHISLGGTSIPSGGAGGSYVVFVKPQEPPLPSTLAITNTVAASGKNYIIDTLAIGKLFYFDRTYTFTSIPSSYTGLKYIKTSTDDRYRTESNFLQFDVNKDVTVYVAYDDRISPKPPWLTSFFTDTGNNVVRIDSSTFSIYSRNYPAGHISLGGTSIPSGGAGGSYVVIVK